MSNSRTTVKPTVGCGGGKITDVGVCIDHSSRKSNSYAGGVREMVSHGSSVFFGGTSRNISDSSTVSARASVDTKKNYSVGISFERKF